MTEYVTGAGVSMYLFGAPPRVLHAHAAAPLQAQANGAHANAQAAGPANGAQVQAQALAQAAAVDNENRENIAPRRRRTRRTTGTGSTNTVRSVRELRRRAHAINPHTHDEQRFRRILGDMNGQQVRDTREYTLDQLEGETGGRSDYIDLRDGVMPGPEVLQDPYSFPSAWSTFEDDV
ncbi:hypothetical protein C2E23DRAFT_593335 [Lenzites betulinus]|nr:hypothetical protein C2E23DRAFT_593335 [Lenzites betulinus]